MVIVDGLESLSQVGGQSADTVAALRRDCLTQLDAIADSLGHRMNAIDLSVKIDESDVSIGGFGIPRGGHVAADIGFRFEAPTTALNAMRVLRGCQLPKAILLEGSPGVGKTSLVSALAAVSGHRLQRINLSDQTDLIDLFGSDLPVEGGQAGEFQWRDAAFLDAMQRGDWVLLDEMNLASQTVLEGLNAVLDHRGTVFIPELGRSFERHSDFRVFAAQNPLQQGGGRKGLPKSFLNRFTKVYLQEHTPEDLLMICRHLYPGDQGLVQRMITFNEIIREATMASRTIGREGSPWEFNLRDLFRWFKLLSEKNGLELTDHPVEYLKLVYLQRFRNERDRAAVMAAFEKVFSVSSRSPRPQALLTPNMFQIGHSLVRRAVKTSFVEMLIRHEHLELAESVLKCIEHGWLVILSGESGVGKRQLLQAIATAAGRCLGEFAMHPGIDTSEMLGSFEQHDIGRLLQDALAQSLKVVDATDDLSAVASAKTEQLQVLCRAASSTPSDSHLQAFVTAARAVLPPGPTSSRAHSALDQLERNGADATGFAWVDGQLLTAIRDGGWFLLSNANLCSPSVLDRLNSLCESNGVLVLSEKGSATGTPEVITPHPDFRLLMTYDPRHGELSRAMRNRGVELNVVGTDSFQDASSAAMAPYSLLQSIYCLDNGAHGASHVANTIASQPKIATSLLRRYSAVRNVSESHAYVMRYLADPAVSTMTTALAGQADSSEVIVSCLFLACPPTAIDYLTLQTIDPSFNPNIPAAPANVVFRLAQLLLRNLDRTRELREWTSLAENAKTLLAKSSFAGKGRARSKMAGGEVWALITGLRSLLTDGLPHAIALDEHIDVSHLCCARLTPWLKARLEFSLWSI